MPASPTSTPSDGSPDGSPGESAEPRFTVRRLTAASAGAIAIVAVDARGPEAALPPGIRPRTGGTPPIGRPVLADLSGVDTGLAVRLPRGVTWLMPHGGVAVVGELERVLRASGGHRASDRDQSTPVTWPEAIDAWEAAALELVASAASPLAIDLLLNQPRRWRGAGGPAATDRNRDLDRDRDRDRRLDRLLTPPLVVIAGPPNVGKSSLTNRLAGRTVSIAADTPGTTRDAPEVRLDLAGLVVRWMDLPGFGPTTDPLERAAVDAARGWLDAADLVVAAADAATGWPELNRAADLRAGLRADRGPTAGADVLVTRDDPSSDLELARAVRDRLVPPDDLTSDAPWNAAGRFARLD